MGGQLPGTLGQQQRPLHHPIRQVVAHIGEAQPGHAGGDALLGVPSPLRCQPLWERLAAGGLGMPAPSGQIPPPWAWWESEAPAARAACSSAQAAVSVGGYRVARNR
jgi:hypothetical protein